MTSNALCSSDVEKWNTSTPSRPSPPPPTLLRAPPYGRVKKKPLHVYRTIFHGFSAVLTAAEADLLGSDPAVLTVLPDRPRRLHTTRTPSSLASSPPTPSPIASSLLPTPARRSVAIAVVDSGIRPDRPFELR